MSNQQRRYICQCGRRKSSLLTLDGGGIRGYASILIIHALMAEVAEIERALDKKHGFDINKDDYRLPLPCHYFDYAAGTSTGGLIALMLGRLRMTVDDVKQAYSRLGKHIFGKSLRIGNLQIDWPGARSDDDQSSARRLKVDWRSSKYDEKNLEQAIKRIVKTHCPDVGGRKTGDERLLDPDLHERSCRTILYALKKKGKNNQEVHPFRSYPHWWQYGFEDRKDVLRHRSANDTSRPLIWEAARATSAAPTYFKTIEIEEQKYMDGGLEVNNPTWEARNEVHGMHEYQCTIGENGCHTRASHQHEHQHRPCTSPSGGIGVIVSIGTGARDPKSVFTDGGWLQQVWAVISHAMRDLTDPEATHRMVDSGCEAAGISYYRFNIDDGLQSIKMDDVAKMGLIRRTVSDLMANRDRDPRKDAFRDKLRSCAHELVIKRREGCASNNGQRFRGLCEPGQIRRDLRTQLNSSHDILDDGSSASHTSSHRHDGVPEIGGPLSPINVVHDSQSLYAIAGAADSSRRFPLGVLQAGAHSSSITLPSRLDTPELGDPRSPNSNPATAYGYLSPHVSSSQSHPRLQVRTNELGSASTRQQELAIEGHEVSDADTMSPRMNGPFEMPIGSNQ